jgi:hypothetical protein
MMRRHELDPVSLTFGFAFAGLGLLFLIGQADEALRLHWVWPLLLIVLGAGILLDVSRTRDRTPDPPAPETTPTDRTPEATRSDWEPEATRSDVEPENAPADPDPDAATAELDPDRAPGRAVDNREHPI